MIGTSNGTILQRSLSDSSIMETSLISDAQIFDAITVDDYGKFGRPLDAMFTTLVIAVGNLTIIALEDY